MPDQDFPIVEERNHGGVRAGAPSTFSINLALLPFVTTTQELVVPRSIRIAFDQEFCFVAKAISAGMRG
ncbi:hypothetical protein ACVIWU_005759 [Bradyrhizobium sp. USDA 4509]|nr:hypothetical protein [Bradyrhizobium elkanii]